MVVGHLRHKGRNFEMSYGSRQGRSVRGEPWPELQIVLLCLVFPSPLTTSTEGSAIRRNLESHEMYKDVNLYNVYFVSKGTGPQTVQIEAQNSAGAKSQFEARYPGAYNITLNQLPRTVKRKSD